MLKPKNQEIEINAKEIKINSLKFAKVTNFFTVPEFMNLVEALEYLKTEISKIKKDINEIEYEKQKIAEYNEKNNFTVTDVEDEITNSFSCYSKAKELMNKLLKNNKPIKLNENMLKAIQEECED